MKSLSFRPGRHERGTAAVEFAILIHTIVILVAAGLFFGRAFWHYTVAEKAAHDAARFLASVSAAEMLTSASTGGDAPVALLAKAIAQAEVKELRPGAKKFPGVEVQCDGATCWGFEIPKNVTVIVTVPMFDDFFTGSSNKFTGGKQVLLKAGATFKYAGN